MNLFDAKRYYDESTEKIYLLHDLAIYCAKRDLKQLAVDIVHEKNPSLQEFDDMMSPLIDDYISLEAKIDQHYSDKIIKLRNLEVDDL